MKPYKDVKAEDLEPYIIVPPPYIPWDDLKKVLGKRRYKKFEKFMIGQTHVPEGVYPWDVENFFSKNRFWD